MEGLRVVFLGGRQAGCIGLLALSGARHEVLGVVAYDAQVRRLAEALGLPLFGSIGEAPVRKLFERSDLVVSVHGREIVPKEMLGLPRLGGVNVHPCLYAYKGASPIERLLQDGNPKASVGVHWMEEKVDSGEVVVEEFVDVTGKKSTDEVYNALYPLYATALLTASAWGARPA